MKLRSALSGSDGPVGVRPRQPGRGRPPGLRSGGRSQACTTVEFALWKLRRVIRGESIELLEDATGSAT